MGFKVRLDMKGTQRLMDLVGDLEKKAPTVLRQAMAVAMRQVKAAAIANAPRDSGLLRRAIGSRAFVTRAKDAVVGEVLVKDDHGGMVVRKGRRKAMYADPAKYAHLVELGTQPHAIGSGSRIWAKRPNKAGKFGVRGQQWGGMHPGTTAVEYMTRALRDNEAAIMATLEAEVMAGLGKIWENG